MPVCKYTTFFPKYKKFLKKVSKHISQPLTLLLFSVDVDTNLANIKKLHSNCIKSLNLHLSQGIPDCRKSLATNKLLCNFLRLMFLQKNLLFPWRTDRLALLGWFGLLLDYVRVAVNVIFIIP